MQDAAGRRSHCFLQEDDGQKSQSGQQRKAGSCGCQLFLYCRKLALRRLSPALQIFTRSRRQLPGEGPLISKIRAGPSVKCDGSGQ